MAAAHPTIVLTESERELFDILLKANARVATPNVLRVAGGWVRDKVRVRRRLFSATTTDVRALLCVCLCLCIRVRSAARP